MGTLYIAAYPASQSAPTRDEIVAGAVPNGVHATDISAPDSTQAGYEPPPISLPPGAQYRFATVWDDGSSRSNMLISPAFTTSGAYNLGQVVMETSSDIVLSGFTHTSLKLGVSFILHGEDSQPVSALDGVLALWWDSETPDGDPRVARSGLSVDASGRFTMDLSEWTTLGEGDYGHLYLLRPDDADYRDDLLFGGRVAVSLV